MVVGSIFNMNWSQGQYRECRHSFVIVFTPLHAVLLWHVPGGTVSAGQLSGLACCQSCRRIQDTPNEHM